LGEGLGIVQAVEPVERDGTGPVEDTVLPDNHIAATLPQTLPDQGWSLGSKGIPVRSEYDEAEQAVVFSTKSPRDAFVVSGTIWHWSALFSLYCLQNLIYDQGNLSFCFCFLCAASRSSFLRCCRLTVLMQFSFTKAVCPNLHISRTTPTNAVEPPIQ